MDSAKRHNCHIKKLRLGYYLPTSVNDKEISPFCEGFIIMKHPRENFRNYISGVCCVSGYADDQGLLFYFFYLTFISMSYLLFLDSGTVNCIFNTTSGNNILNTVMNTGSYSGIEFACMVSIGQSILNPLCTMRRSRGEQGVQATKPEFNVGPLLARHRNGVSLAGR